MCEEIVVNNVFPNAFQIFIFAFNKMFVAQYFYLCTKQRICLAPYWLPSSVANGFDMDNMVVFVTKGGGGLVKAGDPQLQKEGGRVKWRRGGLKWRGLNLAKGTGCQGQLKWLCANCLLFTLPSRKPRCRHVVGLNLSLTLKGWNKIHTLDACLINDL